VSSLIPLTVVFKSEHIAALGRIGRWFVIVYQGVERLHRFGGSSSLRRVSYEAATGIVGVLLIAEPRCELEMGVCGGLGVEWTIEFRFQAGALLLPLDEWEVLNRNPCKGDG